MLDINELKKFGKVQKILKGQYLFQQGDTGQNMYIILAGKVSVSIHSAVDAHITIAELVPGNFVGEMSVLENQPRSADVLTLEDTIVVSIDKINFIEFISSKPDWAFKIMQSLSNRVRKINEKLTANQMKDEDVLKGLQNFLPPTEKKDADIFPEKHKLYKKEVPAEKKQLIRKKHLALHSILDKIRILSPNLSLRTKKFFVKEK